MKHDIKYKKDKMSVSDMTELMSEIFILFGKIGMWLSGIAFVVMLFVSIITVNWSWVAAGVIILSFFVCLILKVAGDDDWLEID